MLALVVGFEAYLSGHASDLTDLSATDWRITSGAVDREARDAELLIFGDSLLKFGVIPDVLERGTGLKTFNLSVLGGQAASSYFLFRRAIEAGARPRAVVLDFQDLPGAVGHPARGLGLRAHLRNWPELVGVREGFELARSMRDAGLFAEVELRRLLPSYKARHEVRSSLWRIVRKGATPARYLANVQRRNWRLNRGTLVMAPKADNPTKVRPAEHAAPPSGWALDPVTDEYLRRFLALAASREIRVFLVLPPTSPEHEGLRIRVGQHDFYSKVVRGLAADFPGVVAVDGRAPGYTRRVFIDDSHLDRRGASGFTSDLAEVIAHSLSDRHAAPRWVDLPPYRERPEPGPIEDLDQSRLALDAPGRTRR